MKACDQSILAISLYHQDDDGASPSVHVKFVDASPQRAVHDFSWGLDFLDLRGRLFFWGFCMVYIYFGASEDSSDSEACSSWVQNPESNSVCRGRHLTRALANETQSEKLLGKSNSGSLQKVFPNNPPAASGPGAASTWQHKSILSESRNIHIIISLMLQPNRAISSSPCRKMPSLLQ